MIKNSSDGVQPDEEVKNSP
jgi:hypothetical protein